jgi:hypothetical protein
MCTPVFKVQIHKKEPKRKSSSSHFIRESIAHLQRNQTLTTFGSFPKDPQISLQEKFDGTLSKFQGFINQVCLII